MVNLSAFIHFHALRQPGKTALVYDGSRISYAELDGRIGRAAAFLASRGVGAGDIVAVFMKNSAAFVELAFATSHLGAVFLPVNFRLSGEECGYIVTHAGARLLLADEEFAAVVAGLDNVVLVNAAAQADSGRLGSPELPVVAPLADAEGETLFTHEGYRFALFPRKGGQAPEPGDPDQLHRMGMLLGRLHAVARRHAFLHRPRLTVERFLVQPAQAVQATGLLPEALQPRYRSVVARLGAKIRDTGLEAAAVMRTHGDCHPGNIIWTRDDGPWVVDFDDCQSAPAVQDLWMLLSGTRHEQEMQLAELLDGYAMFCDFDSRELAFVEALRSLRMAHYAGWLAQRWNDPAFPRYFPWFNTPAYWEQHVAELEEQCTRMDEPPLRWL